MPYRFYVDTDQLLPATELDVEESQILDDVRKERWEEIRENTFTPREKEIESHG